MSQLKLVAVSGVNYHFAQCMMGLHCHIHQILVTSMEKNVLGSCDCMCEISIWLEH